MTRLRDFLFAVRALLRGEPVLAAAVLAVAVDLLVQLQGDGLQLDEIPRLVATAVLGVIVRTATTPAASPVAPSLPTDPTLPAEPRPVLTLSGWRR